MDSIAVVNALLLFGSGLVVAGIASSLIASRFGAPLLLVFIAMGMLAGEDGPGGVVFDDYAATFFIGSVALAIILFDGGLRTQLVVMRGALAPAIVLATLGVVITTALAGLGAMAVLGVGPLEGLLVGAIVASTDAAAVFFLLRSKGLQLRRRVGATLEIESSTNDPVAMLMVLTLVEAILAGGQGTFIETLGQVLSHTIIGAALGLAGGFALTWSINRLAFPAGLHPLFVVACAILIYALTALVEGSSFLAVYLAGLVVGNRPVRAFASVLSFHDAATWLAQIVMFLVMGLLVTPKTLIAYILPGLAVALLLTFVARPVAVWLSLAPFPFSAREKLFVSWVGLRGAVSIFFAAIPMMAGLPNAEAYFNVAFFVLLFSLVVQGWSISFAARRSGVALADPAPAVDRVEIDLPGQLDLEMVGYPIVAESPILDGGVPPSWARAVFVVRESAMLTPDQAGLLRVGDYAYFFAPPHRVRRLDRLFAPFEGHHDRALSGVFSFGPETRLADVAQAYGAPLDPRIKEQTLGALFAETFEEGVREGDRIALGPVTLVARAVEDGAVRSVALILDDPSEASALDTKAPGAPWANPRMRAQEAWLRLRARLSGAARQG